MIAFPGENLIVLLRGLKSNSVSLHGANQERRTVDEIIHYVLELWHQRLLVNEVEVNFPLRGNLNPDISSNEENSTSHVMDCMIVSPFARFFVDLEEHHFS